MRDQPQTWSDRQEPVMEGVPAQRVPAEEQPAGTGPDGAWAPAGAPDGDAAVENGDRAVENGNVENGDRAVGVASVPGEGAAPDEDALRDEDADDEIRDAEIRDDGALHDAADEVHDDDHDRPLVDNGDDDGTLYRSEADTEAADTEAAEAEAAEVVTGTSAAGTGLMPGDVPQEPVSALFEPSVAGDFRDRWQRVQMQFVDNPRAAAEQAMALVDDVFTALQEALANQRGALDSWQSGQAGDTEELRVAVRRYRDFLDRVLGM